MTATPTDAARDRGWAVVVPVKRLDLAKTRLSRFAGDHRARLASAFAADTVAAALACPAVEGVIVVTDDTEVAEIARGLGATVVTDAPDDGLNPALAYGADRAAALFPSSPLAALSSDLPALRSDELSVALLAARAHPTAFVSDAEGIGTTLLTATTRAAFEPRFGHRSRAAHRRAGVVELTDGGLASLRRDVDTEVDLYDAQRLGLGQRSVLALGELQRERASL